MACGLQSGKLRVKGFTINFVLIIIQNCYWLLYVNIFEVTVNGLQKLAKIDRIWCVHCKQTCKNVLHFDTCIDMQKAFDWLN